MKLGDLLLFASTALRGHTLRTVLSVLGVTIGVTSVVLLTALGEGARVYVTSELASLGSNVLIVLPGKVETAGAVPFVGGVPHDLTLEDAEIMKRRIPQIKQFAPLVLGQGAASSGSLSRNVTVLGTTSEFKSLRRLELSQGSFLPEGEIGRGSPVCVIGTTIERELFPGETALGRVLRIDDFRFRIIGILSAKGESMGFNIDEVVMIPVSTSMKMFNQTTLFRIMIETNSFEDLEPVKGRITEIITDRHDEEDITILTQDSVLASFNRIFVALTLALAGIAAISLTVAGIGIMNVMLVSVSERTAEVGLMKAVGVTRGQIVSVFLAEAAILAIGGGILGLVAAQIVVTIASALYPALPLNVPPWAVASSIATAVAVGLIFGVLPARKAARLDPITSLARR